MRSSSSRQYQTIFPMGRNAEPMRDPVAFLLLRREGPGSGGGAVVPRPGKLILEACQPPGARERGPFRESTKVREAARNGPQRDVSLDTIKTRDDKT